MTARPRLAFAALALLLAAAAWAELTVGALAISPANVFSALVGRGDSADGWAVATVLHLRLPRLVLALLAGAALALSGAAMQGLFRNPLADPGLVGVGAGSALGAALALMLTAASSAAWPAAVTPPIAAFVGGLAAAGLASLLARRSGSTEPATLLLAGLAINALAASGIGFIVALASPMALKDITFWMFGAVSKAGWTQIAVVAIPLVAALLWLPRQAKALDLLALGEAEALHLGLNPTRARRHLLLAIVLCVSCSVAVTGLIGFVGLLVPHLMRLWLGPRHRLVLPASALGGAALLAWADVAARSLLPPQELPVGVLTTALGAPFFIYLLLRHRSC